MPIRMPPTAAVAGSGDGLFALRSHEDHRAERARQLQAVAEDASLGTVARTRARVELALIGCDDGAHEVHHRRWLDEVEAIRRNSVVCEATKAVERGIEDNEDRLAAEWAIRRHLEHLREVATRRRHEARLLSEERRIKCAEAEAMQREAEEVSEEAMATAEAAMLIARERDDTETMASASEAMKNARIALLELEELQKRAKEERQLYEEAQMKEESLLEELKAKEQGCDGHIKGYDTQPTSSLVKESKSCGLQRIEVGCTELSNQVAKLQATVSELLATNTRQQAQMKTLEGNIGASGATQPYWKSQLDRLSTELRNIQAEEGKLELYKRKAASKDEEIQHLRAEVRDLHSMKESLEQRLSEVEDSAQADLQALSGEVTSLLAGKERILIDTEDGKASCERLMADQERLVGELQNCHRERMKKARSEVKTKAEMARGQKEQEVNGPSSFELESYQKQIAKLELINKMQKIANDKMKRQLLEKGREAHGLPSSVAATATTAEESDSSISSIDATASSVDATLSAGNGTVSSDGATVSSDYITVSSDDATVASHDSICLDCADEANPNQGKLVHQLNGEQTVYQLSCRCCESDLRYFGKTKQNLSSQVKQHFTELWDIVQKDTNDEQDQSIGADFVSSPFGKHCYKHCQRSGSLEEVLAWGFANIKVQHQVIREKVLTDDRFMAPTVFQLSCRDCNSDLRYIGSSNKDLSNEVWRIVQKKYLGKGMCASVDGRECRLDQFESVVAHFAKHCGYSKTEAEVRKWCEQNIEVEEWNMENRFCHVTAIEHSNEGDGLKIAFKVESTFGPTRQDV